MRIAFHAPLTALLLLWGLTESRAQGLADGKLRLEGLRTVTEEQVEKWVASQLEFIEATEVNMARADDVAYFLEIALRDRGYEDATVDWNLSRNAAGNQVIVLSVFEGREIALGDIVVLGNEAVEDDGVVELMTSATRKRLEIDNTDELPYVEADIEAGRERVLEFHRLLGFSDVEVDVQTELSGGTANIAVTIVEGRVYRVGELTLPEPPVPEVERGYDKIREDFEGKSYSLAVRENLASRVREIAVDAGYYYAVAAAKEVSTEISGDAGRVDLAVTADWGERVRVAAVSVEGNAKVKDKFFARHFEELVGEPYSPDTTNRQVEELLQTGAFETVRTDIVEQPDGSFVLDVEVEEGPSRTLGVYAGFATYEGGIGGFEFQNLNLLGSVRKINAAVEFSSRGARGEVEYTDPWFLWSDVALRTGLFAINRAEEGYEKFKTGGRYEFTRKFGRKEKNAVSFFGEASYTDVHKAEIDPLFLGDRKYLAHAAGVSLTHDRRDNPRAPRSGFIARTSVSAASSAIGSEVEFLKATGRLGYYLPVGEHTLRLAARGGTIAPMGDTDAIPIDLRFFNGGAQSVRSFQERSLGPRDPSSGHPVGGEFFTVFNIEYEIPIQAMDGLSIVPFADAGNVIVEAEDAALDDLRYAVGLGLRYRTPIGPLRLEYGFNPDQRPGEPQGTFHFGFGFAY
ncbi:MAG: BamA/TamA family outer membrane protein [Verrucomicrobiales bacterium]